MLINVFIVTIKIFAGHFYIWIILSALVKYSVKMLYKQ